MQLSPLQQSIIDAPYNKVVVIAAAASGKTQTMTEKVRQLLRANVNPKQIAVITFTNMAASELRQRLGEDYKDGLFVGTIHALANYMLSVARINTRKVLDEENFDKLFEMVKENPKCIRHYEWILLDEAQDSDQNQFDFIFKMINPEHFFIVGDMRQCQPAGTKIYLRDGIVKNIEDVQVGDEIMWYENENGRCCGISSKSHNSKHKFVTETNSRDFVNDELITIKSQEGYISSYTPNHRTFIRIRDDTEYKYCVYLMCDENNRFRIGKIALRGTKTKNGNPWRDKLKAEKCQKIWLLKVFKTDKEARVLEQKLSYKYSIPQICWQIDKVTWTQEDINYIYEGLNTYESAKKCLQEFHRNIEYPIIDINDGWSFLQHFASNATAQIYAANIMSEVMDCLVYDYDTSNHSRKKFSHIIEEKRQFITNPIKVYSLKVDGETYIADNIVTHNCIYQFNGSRPELLASLARDPSVHTMSLNENYRNGYNILKFAKNIIERTGLKDDSVSRKSGNGVVREVPYNIDIIIDRIRSEGEYRDWAILARTNSQLEHIAAALSANSIPWDTFKQGELKKLELTERMNANTVKCLTIHSSKGLEFQNVIVIGARFRPVEELNVCYVAATRAKELLIWMTGQAKKRRY